MSKRFTLKKSEGFHPKKYYRGLTRKQAIERRKEIEKFGKMHWRDPRAYVGFKTDKGEKGRTSSYTVRFRREFPDAKSLEEKSKATGVPVKFIRETYHKGTAAWRTGHRVGINPQRWGYARVHSLLMCGKTYYTADADIVRRAKKESAKARKWFKRCVTRKK